MIDDEISLCSSESDCESSVLVGSSEDNYVDSTRLFDRCIYSLHNSRRGHSRLKANSGQFQFSDGQHIEDLPKFPPEKCYWHYLAQRTNADAYSEEFVSSILDKKLGKLADYFKRLRLDQLTKKELMKKKPTNFYGPYFPTPIEIERLYSLSININWSVPKNHVSFNPVARKPFSTKELEYLIRRWEKFQKAYNIYDLRPILGVRCGLYDEDLGFKFFRMIDQHSYMSFLQWMGKGLPNHCALSIRRKLVCLTDWFHEGRFQIKKYLPFTGLEYKCIEVIYDRYGYDCASIMELIIGKRYKWKYHLQLSTFAAIKHIPIKHGNWTKQEDLEILKYVVRFLKVKDLNELLTCKYRKKLGMFDLFNVMKSRTPEMLRKRWLLLKQILTTADFLKKKSVIDEKELIWSHEDYVNLICKLYETKAETITEVDWLNIAKSFPGFCDLSIKRKFYFLLKTRVPMQKHKNFDESLEYLYHNVTPVFKLKQVRQNKIRQDLIYAAKLHKCIKKSMRLAEYFEEEEIEDHDDDSRILSELRNENSYLEELNSSQKFTSVLKVASNNTINRKRKRGQESEESTLENDMQIVIEDSKSRHVMNKGKKKKIDKHSQI